MSFQEFWQQFYIKFIGYGEYQIEKSAGLPVTWGPFTKYHFISTSIAVIFIVLYLILTRKFDSKRLMKHQKIIAWVMLVLEIIRIISTKVYNRSPWLLRFDYCNQVCLLLPIIIIFKIKFLYPAIMAIAFWGGFGVLCYPLYVFVDYGGFHMLSVQSMISHTLMVLSSFLLARMNKVELKKDFLKAFFSFLFIEALAITFSIIRTNITGEPVSYIAFRSGVGLPLIGKVPFPWHNIFVVGIIDLGLFVFLLVSKLLDKYILCKDLKESLVEGENIDDELQKSNIAS